MSSRPLLIGHRGHPAKFPENTLLSFLAPLYYGPTRLSSMYG